MNLEQCLWQHGLGWVSDNPGSLAKKAQLVLVFGARRQLSQHLQELGLTEIYPNACVVGCSTAGEIHGTLALEESITVMAIQFERTEVRSAEVSVANPSLSYTAGRELSQSLNGEKLKHVFLLSNGFGINNSAFLAGLREGLSPQILITGGVAGDAEKFEQTLVIHNQKSLTESIVGIGLYGDHIHVGHGTMGGWDSFGPERLITKSDGNILYELDGKNALELYKKYLGPHAKELPLSALRFPLSIRPNRQVDPVVRTILNVDHDHGSMTFAGDVPEGFYSRFMRANVERVIQAASSAASQGIRGLPQSETHLAILISCVGRKLILKQRTEEELENVREVFGSKTLLTGFYSYGEISPLVSGTECKIHNQTMTLTTISERAA